MSKWLENALLLSRAHDDNRDVRDISAITMAIVTNVIGHAVEATKNVTASLEEYIAKIEAETRLPREWAEAFARISLVRCSPKFSKSTWQRVQNNASVVLDKHIKDIIRTGWGILDIFGCHALTPEARYDAMGLLLAMSDDDVIISISPSQIGLRKKSTGSVQCYIKRRASEEMVTLWEVI